jgi:hypothetical protein
MIIAGGAAGPRTQNTAPTLADGRWTGASKHCTFTQYFDGFPTMMRPRLTANDLARLYDESPSPAMRTVLWEVAKLHCTIKRAYAVRKDLGNNCPPGVDTTTWKCFIYEIDAEPCLSDERTPRQQKRIAEGVARIKDKERK